MRIIKIVLSIVIICSFLFSFTACSDNGNKDVDRTEKLAETAMNINNININALEFQIYFYIIYNNFLTSTSGGSSSGLNSSVSLKEQTCAISGYTDMTWAQYFVNSTESYCQELYSIVSEAEAEGYEMSQAEKDSFAQQAETFRESVKSDAEANNQSEEKTLATLYGDDVTYEDIESINERIAYYSSYLTSKTVKDYSDEEIAAYYNENKNEIDTVTLRVAPIFYTTSITQNNPYGYPDKQTAYNQATEFASRITSEEVFLSILDEYINESVSNYYGSNDYTLTKNITYSGFSAGQDGKDWAFDESRKTGDVEVFDNETSYLVVFYISRDTKDYNYVDVRNILVKGFTDESKKKAEDIYNEWLSGTATEESFAELAEKYSEDTGSNENGGLYSDITKGSFVTELDEWSFDQSRLPGDCEIILGKYGYYIMYFSKKGSNVRKTLVEKALQNKLYSEVLKSAIEKYPYTSYKSVMLSVIP